MLRCFCRNCFEVDSALRAKLPRQHDDSNSALIYFLRHVFVLLSRRCAVVWMVNVLELFENKCATVIIAIHAVNRLSKVDRSATPSSGFERTSGEARSGMGRYVTCNVYVM